MRSIRRALVVTSVLASSACASAPAQKSVTTTKPTAIQNPPIAEPDAGRRSSASSASSSVEASATYPPGWVRFDGPPTFKTVECANWAKRVWTVELRHGAVSIVPFVSNDEGDAMPFPFHPSRHEIDQDLVLQGTRHVYPLAQGYLVGFDMGEWGGAIYFFSRDGKRRKRLEGGNVHGFVNLRSSLIALVGVAHLTIDEGALMKIQATSPYKVEQWMDIGTAPEAYFLESPESLVIAGNNAIFRVSDDGRIKKIDEVDLGTLFPNSIVVDTDGVIYVGMRQFVVRWIPNGSNSYRQEWLTRDDCTVMERDDKAFDCHCVQPPKQ